MKQTASLESVEKLLGNIVSHANKLKSASEKIKEDWHWLETFSHRFDKSGLVHIVPFNETFGKSIRRINAALDAGYLSTEKFDSQAKLLREEISRLSLTMDSKTGAEKSMAFSMHQSASEQLRKVEATRAEIDINNKLVTNMGIIHEHYTHLAKVIGLAGAETYLFAKSMVINAELNRQLVSANSNLTLRSKLTKDIYATQQRLGSKDSEIGKASASLVFYGLEQNKGFRQNLELVTQLNEGLGLSVESGSRLAWLSQSMHVGFKGVADTLSNIVDRTSLIADEAAKMVENIADGLRMLRSTGQLSGISHEFGLIEDRVKRLTGKSGEMSSLAKWITTTSEGAMMGQGLGISPESIMGAGGAGFLEKRLAAMANQFTRGGGVIGRTTGLEQLSELLGGMVSTQTLNQMAQYSESMRDTHNGLGQAVSLSERWKNQVTESGEQFSKVWNSFKAMGMVVLTPILHILNKLMSAVGPLLQGLSQCKVAIWGVSVALFGLAAHTLVSVTRRSWALIIALHDLSKTLMEAALAAKVANAASVPNVGKFMPNLADVEKKGLFKRLFSAPEMEHGTQVGGGLFRRSFSWHDIFTTGLLSKMMMVIRGSLGWLTSIVTSIVTTPALWVAASAAGGYYLGKKWNDFMQATMAPDTRSRQTMEAKFFSGLRRIASEKGDPDLVERVAKGQIANFRKYDSDLFPEARLRNMLTEATRIADDAQRVRVSALVNQPKEEVDKAKLQQAEDSQWRSYWFKKTTDNDNRTEATNQQRLREAIRANENISKTNEQNILRNPITTPDPLLKSIQHMYPAISF